MIDLSIIIVSYNTKEFLRKCINSIFESSGSFTLELIVVDNASRDGTVEDLRGLGKKIKIIENKQACSLVILENSINLGFSRANNQGIKIAKGRYLLFLNPDTQVYPNTLAYMVKFMDKKGGTKNVGAATCKIILPNGKLDESAHRGFPTPWNALSHFSGISRIFPRSKIFSGYHLGWMDLSKEHEIDSLGGSFMLVRREAGDQVGWWDNDYFFYGEDIDFCYRLKEKGWKIFYIPQVKTLHYKGVSSGIKRESADLTTAKKQTKRIATLARYNAMKIFYKKHYTNKYPRALTWLVLKGIDLKKWISLKLI